ncbi:MAG: glucosaminidase domain-containing protein [Bacteroidota bacterium]|jgi:Bax protein
MKKQYLILCLVFFLFYGRANSQNKFFNEYRSLADSLAAVYQMPASVILAVAYHESGGGSSIIGRRLNNHFGLKGRVVGGDTVSVKSSYKYFAKPADSYIYFCNLVARKKFYPTLKGNKDYKKWVISISNTGYAANAKVWSKHIIGVIEKYHLEK